MITENLSTLKINKMTQEQYDRELAADNINASELYLTPMEDHVIDQGKAGNWTYRNWANGTYECWGKIPSTITAIVSSSVFGGNNAYGTVSFPTVFIETPVVNYALYATNGYDFAGKANVSTGSFTWYALSNATLSVGGAVTVNVHVRGRWK